MISRYVYDEFNRLQFVVDKDGEVVEQIQYNYAIEELSGSIESSTSSALVGDQVNFNAIVLGGTGDFSYDWTVPGLTNLPDSDNISFTAIASQVPNVTATCVVTDNNTNETLTLTKQISVSQGSTPLSVSTISTSTGSTYTSVGSRINYTVNVSGGSGNYSYQWTKTNGQNTTTLFASGPQARRVLVSASDCGSFTITCKVTDTVTNEVKTKSVLMTILMGCSGNNQ
jgi:hypothetical protein